jgi:hypothetical protein
VLGPGRLGMDLYSAERALEPFAAGEDMMDMINSEVLFRVLRRLWPQGSTGVSGSGGCGWRIS